jgi:CheY-like chemotaxis protein
MRKVLEITFAGEDFNTVVAASGQEAMQAVSRQAPGIILLDHTLGDGNGYDLCQQIKGVAPGSKVIILSSKQHPYDRARGSAAGADDFMDKPFDTQKLLDKVNAVLSQASAVPSAAGPPPKPAHAVAPAPTATVGGGRARSPTLSYGTPSPGASGTPQPPQPARHGGTLTGTPAMAKPAARPQPAAKASPTAPSFAASPAAATSGNGQLAGKLEGLGLSPEQVQSVLALSREVVEQVVWEVVPVLAETIIKEEIRRLTSE